MSLSLHNAKAAFGLVCGNAVGPLFETWFEVLSRTFVLRWRLFIDLCCNGLGLQFCPASSYTEPSLKPQILSTFCTRSVFEFEGSNLREENL